VRSGKLCQTSWKVRSGSWGHIISLVKAPSYKLAEVNHTGLDNLILNELLAWAWLHLLPIMGAGDPPLNLYATRTHSLTDVATLNELEGIAMELDGKASAQDIKLLAKQQQSLAQSVSGMAEWLAVRPETADGAKGTGSSATKFK